MLIAQFQPKPPYDFPHLLAVLARYAYPSLDFVHENAYWRILAAGDALALVRVVSRGTRDEPLLEAHLVSATGEIDPDLLRRKLDYMLHLNVDHSAFYDAARSYPELWRVVEPIYGLPSLRSESIFEALMLTVIEQQIAWVAAQRGQRFMVEWGGRCIRFNGKTFYAFPTPEQIAAAQEEELRPTKITNRRIRLMIDIARRQAAGELDLERLRDLSPEEAFGALVSMKGIGGWTAAWTINRGLGHLGFVGYNDVALQAAVNHYFYGQKGRLTEEQVQATFERYGAFAGAAAFFTITRWVLDRYADSLAQVELNGHSTY
jgi:DNA-3-methyladenine glycosylase II